MRDYTLLFAMLEILREYSDDEHTLTVTDIIEKIKILYGREVDRRTVISGMDFLQEHGCIIERSPNGRFRYHMLERPFSTPELRLLIDAIYSCSFISPQQTKELLEKILSQVSVYDRKKYTYTNILLTEKKSPNKQVFLNIELLDKAINEHKKIAFTYTDYDYNANLVPRRSEKYIASPYNMININEHYYLVLLLDGKPDPGFYRIDLIRDIEILKTPRAVTKEEFKLNNIHKVVYAYYGKPERVTLKCDKKALRYVIERFGSDIKINKQEDGSFITTVYAAPEGLVYWALQYMKIVEVIEPKHIRNQIIQSIKEGVYYDSL